MRLGTFFLAFLILLLETSSDEVAIKRHISKSTENDVAPKIGKSLRSYKTETENNMLEIRLDGIMEMGAYLSLSVSLQNGSGEITKCQWTSPQGTVYLVYGDAMLENDGLLADDLEGNITNAKSCFINLKSFKESDIGTWMCRIEHSTSKKFQETSIILLPPFQRVSDVRLPKHLKPEKYSLYLTPFIIQDNFTIEGHVDILAKVVEPGAKNITLHREKIVIFENLLKVTSTDGKNFEITGFSYDMMKDFFIIILKETLPVGQDIKISIDYLALLSPDLMGFYRSSYFDSDTNKLEFLATTQFEATGARRALPCFDEPAFKAIFEVNLGRTKDMSSISNMPIKFESVPMADNDDYVWDMYQESPKMSTYLLAFVISKFSYKKGITRANGVEFRIWSRKSMLDQTALAADIGPKIMEFYEEHFNISYPLPKMDMIAIPDFSAGAMENWGLITYRESTMLIDEEFSSDANLEQIQHVIAHEMAHQWFGNLVTMEWWSDLWLNEGFAHYMQYLGADHVKHSDTGIFDRFVLSGIQSTFEKDSLDSSHPISVPVHHPSEIHENFDSISYQKGGSVIRMMANFLGVNVFNKGVENYLKKHSYGNAKQDDLWAALTDVAQSSGSLDTNMTLKEIMDSWTLQMGFPLVTAIRSYGNDSSKLELSQKRFVYSYESTSTEDNNHFRWWIPISYTTPKNGFENTKNQYWISPEEETKTVSLGEELDDDEPLILNVKQTGFYRVNYDKTNWEKISEALLKDHNVIHRINRAQILDDSLTLANAGFLDYQTALGPTEYLSEELDYIPWSAVLSKFDYIGRMLGRTAGYGAYKEYIIFQLMPIYNHLGFDNKPSDTSIDIKLRSSVISTLCELGHDDCVQRVTEIFRSRQARKLDESDGKQDIVSTIYCTAISNGDEKDWNYLWERYLRVEDNPEERNLILSALTCTKEIWLLQSLLDMSVNETSAIRRQDSVGVIARIASTKIGRDLTWKWLRQNWDYLHFNFEILNHIGIGAVIGECASDFNRPLELKELEEFYKHYLPTLGQTQRILETAMQRTKVNILWMEKHYEEIVDWFKKKNESRRRYY